MSKHKKRGLLQKVRALFSPIDWANSTPWDQFLISLNETIEWVTGAMDLNAPAYNSRSPTLAPDALAGSRKKVVDSVQYRRWYELQFQKFPIDQPALSLRSGRLLAFQPDGTASDGAEQETNGFFQGDNTPAWDTWVGWFQDIKGTNYGYLVCWIPPQMINAVSSGIDVNPEECIWWLDEKPNALADKLRRERCL